MLTYYFYILKTFLNFKVSRVPTDSSWTGEGNRVAAKAARWDKNLVPIDKYGYYTSSFLDKQYLHFYMPTMRKTPNAELYKI